MCNRHGHVLVEDGELVVIIDSAEISPGFDFVKFCEDARQRYRQENPLTPEECFVKPEKSV